MRSFGKKKVVQQNTLGDKLRRIRIEKDLSLEEVYKETEIQIKHLEDLEFGRYQDLPGDIYAKAWIRKYAEFLGLDSQDLLVDYKIEKSVSDKLNSQKKDKNISFKAKKINLQPSTVIRFIGILLIVLSVISYLAWEIKNIISPPEVNIIYPEKDIKTIETSIEIIGQTEPEVILTINDEPVLLDDDGNFREEVNLVIGLNNLNINAKKKHSKTRNIELKILREAVE